MREEFSIDISGIEETCEMLTAAPRKIAKVAFARALAAAAVPIVEELQATTPVAEYPAGMFSAPGSLEAHIVTDIALDEGGQGGQASIGFGKYGAVANLVEYGHRMVGHAPTKQQKSVVRAHPFMRPAAAASADAAIDAFNESVRATMSEGIPGMLTQGVA